MTWRRVRTGNITAGLTSRGRATGSAQASSGCRAPPCHGQGRVGAGTVGTDAGVSLPRPIVSDVTKACAISRSISIRRRTGVVPAMGGIPRAVRVATVTTVTMVAVMVTMVGGIARAHRIHGDSGPMQGHRSWSTTGMGTLACVAHSRLAWPMMIRTLHARTTARSLYRAAFGTPGGSAGRTGLKGQTRRSHPIRRYKWHRRHKARRSQHAVQGRTDLSRHPRTHNLA
jgi:hypothetical protein